MNGAIKELINTGGDARICLLGIDKVEIGKIDGLYPNQAIVKFIDEMTSEEVADFIHEKFLQIVEKEQKSIANIRILFLTKHSVLSRNLVR